jgi:predicted acetyltransferase
MAVKIYPINYRDHQMIKSMYPLYIHDLSEFGGGYQFSENGTWEPDYVPFWLAGQQGAQVLVIRHEKTPIGFACVGRGSFPYKSDRVDQRLCEFFILRSHRGHGYGTEAGCQVLQYFRGNWELMVLQGNHSAIALWRGVIARCRARDVKETSDTSGITLRFVISKASR